MVNISEKRIRALTTIGRSLTTASTVDDVLKLAIEGSKSVLDAKGAALYLADEDDFVLRASFGWQATDDEQRRHSNEVENFRRWVIGPERTALPLRGEGGFNGLMVVRFEHRISMEDSDRWLLAVFADHLSTALANVKKQRVTRRLREKLDKTEKRAAATSGAMSELGHDVRSPLNGILMQVDLLDSDLLGTLTAEQREALTQIRTAINQIEELSSGMVQSARILAGEIDPHLADFDLAELVEDGMEALQTQIEANRLCVELAVAPSIGVHGDYDLARRAVANVLDNAVKYTPHGGRILIESDTQNYAPDVAVRISDSGGGVPEQSSATIFEPFVRAPSGAGASGTGLGLAIARRLARAMGGDVVLERPDQPIGARFALLFRPAGNPPPTDR